jgi:hypothetical protein
LAIDVSVDPAGYLQRIAGDRNFRRGIERFRGGHGEELQCEAEEQGQAHR